jgi:hypothetical protein
MYGGAVAQAGFCGFLASDRTNFTDSAVACGGFFEKI